MGFAAATLFIGGVSALQQRSAARDAERSNIEREKLNQRRADVKSARVRTRQVRAARRARAQNLAAGQSGAGTGGSGLVGAQTNIGNQLASNIGFLNQNQDISNSLTNLNIATARNTARNTSRQALTTGIGSFISSNEDIFA